MDVSRHPRRDDGGRRRDAAFVLPVFCALILLPPFVNLFVREVLVWGIPLEVLYLFGVWFLLVIGAMALARGLSEPEAGRTQPAPPPVHASGPAAADRTGKVIDLQGKG